MRVYFTGFDDEYSIAYFPDSKRFFKVNKNGRNLTDNIVNEKKDVGFDLSTHEYNKYVEQVNEYCKDIGYSEINNASMLSRLVIHITNL